jgi:hypothetical protein
VSYVIVPARREIERVVFSKFRLCLCEVVSNNAKRIYPSTLGGIAIAQEPAKKEYVPVRLYVLDIVVPP